MMKVLFASFLHCKVTLCPPPPLLYVLSGNKMLSSAVTPSQQGGREGQAFLSPYSDVSWEQDDGHSLVLDLVGLPSRGDTHQKRKDKFTSFACCEGNKLGQGGQAMRPGP